MNDKIIETINSAPEENKTKLKVLYNAVKKSMASYNSTQKPADLTAWKAAEKELTAELEKLPQKETDRFKSRKKALDWMKENDFPISQGKFYQDCKAGYPAVARDGSVSKFQVLSYCHKNTKDTKADMDAIDSSEFVIRKAKADANMAEMKAKKMQREQDKMWLHADEAWAVVAALTGKLRDSIRHHIYTSQRELVQIAGGEQERTQEAFEFIDTQVDKAFNEVAGSAIDIKFEREVE